MSSRSSSGGNRRDRMRTSSVVYPYEDQTISEYDETRPLSLNSSRLSKKIRVCTLCGKCKGVRTVPKSSRLSFHSTTNETYKPRLIFILYLINYQQLNLFERFLFILGIHKFQINNNELTMLACLVSSIHHGVYSSMFGIKEKECFNDHIIIVYAHSNAPLLIHNTMHCNCFAYTSFGYDCCTLCNYSRDCSFDNRQSSIGLQFSSNRSNSRSKFSSSC